MPRSLITVIFALITALSAHAQGEDPVHFRTLCLQGLPGIPTLHYLPALKKGAIEVELPEANLSKERYQADRRTIHFYAAAPDPAAEKLPKPVATVRIPANIKQAILLFLPTAAGKSYHVTAYDASLLAFRGGDQRFVNLTKVPLAIDLGGKRAAIKPGDTHALRIPGNPKARHALQLFHQQDEKWHRFSSSRVTVDPRIRRLILCYYDPSEKRVRSRAIWDRIDNPKPAAPANQ